MEIRGMMDGWHGDEPEIEIVNNLRRKEMEMYQESYIDPMGDYLPAEDDDRRQWELELERRDAEYIAPLPPKHDHMDLLFEQIENLKKLYGAK